MENEDAMRKVAAAYKARENSVNVAKQEQDRVNALIAGGGAGLILAVKQSLETSIRAFNGMTGEESIVFNDNVGELAISLVGSVPASIRVTTEPAGIYWGATDNYGRKRTYTYTLSALPGGQLQFRDASYPPDISWLSPEDVASEIFSSITAGILPPP